MRLSETDFWQINIYVKQGWIGSIDRFSPASPTLHCLFGLIWISTICTIKPLTFQLRFALEPIVSTDVVYSRIPCDCCRCRMITVNYTTFANSMIVPFNNRRLNRETRRNRRNLNRKNLSYDIFYEELFDLAKLETLFITRVGWQFK